jgi:Putative restriction endonuclease
LSLAATDVIDMAMQRSTMTRITPEQFFARVSGREERCELVDGEGVMMAGAGRRHDRIVVNLTASVRRMQRPFWQALHPSVAVQTYAAMTASGLKRRS